MPRDHAPLDEAPRRWEPEFERRTSTAVERPGALPPFRSESPDEASVGPWGLLYNAMKAEDQIRSASRGRYSGRARHVGHA